MGADAGMLAAAYVVGTAYAVLGLIAGWKLLLIVDATTRCCEWSTQRVFHLLIVIASASECVLGALWSWVVLRDARLGRCMDDARLVCLRMARSCDLSIAVRCAFFFAAPRWEGAYFYIKMAATDEGSFVLYVLDEFPNYIVLASYVIMAFWWADIYHFAEESRGYFRGRIRPLVMLVLLLLFLLQLCVWIGFEATGGSYFQDGWSLLGASASAASFVTASVLYCVYGPRLASTLSRTAFSLGLRQRKILETRLTAALCAVCFALRAVALVVAAVASVNRWPGFDDVFSSGDAALFSVYYLLLEVCPAAVLLHHHGSIPPPQPGGGRLGRIALRLCPSGCGLAALANSRFSGGSARCCSACGWGGTAAERRRLVVSRGGDDDSDRACRTCRLVCCSPGSHCWECCWSCRQCVTWYLCCHQPSAQEEDARQAKRRRRWGRRLRRLTSTDPSWGVRALVALSTCQCCARPLAVQSHYRWHRSRVLRDDALDAVPSDLASDYGATSAAGDPKMSFASSDVESSETEEGGSSGGMVTAMSAAMVTPPLTGSANQGVSGAMLGAASLVSGWRSPRAAATGERIESRLVRGGFVDG
jgi:hypothetical protein